MDIVIETRENIVSTNNTAQESLTTILEGLSQEIKELVIQDSLSGNVDFSILEQMGFKNVRTISFTKKGQVTALWNLPSKLNKLQCNDQYLLELENLPSGLIELHCSHNHLRSIDLSKLNKLRILGISDNIFSELENIPHGLEELYCNNNNIRNLNLRDVISLKVLHISNNKTVIIENLPASIIDFKSENNPYINIDYANSHNKEVANNISIDYIEALHEYFKLKNNYEAILHADKKKAFEKGSNKKIKRQLVSRVIPKCINCKKAGGTIFTTKVQNYYAICGSKTPCNLNIQLENGLCYNTSNTLFLEKNELDEIKTKMIVEKLNNVFNYTNEQTSVKLFKEYLEQFNYYNKEYAEILEQYNNQYKDKLREEKIAAKQQQIYTILDSIKELVNQYKKDGNTELLKNAIDIQIKELHPEIHNLRLLKYEIMEMDFTSSRGMIQSVGTGTDADDGDLGPNSANLISVLKQRYVGLQKMQHWFDVKPNVVKYNK
jgi:hypothetical protein